MADEHPLLEATGLGKVFGGVQALTDVDVQLHAGRTLGIIGPNGAGKSTLINALSGLFQPTSGSVWLDGQNVARKSMAARTRLGLLRTFQGIRTFGTMTVRECMELACEAPRARASEPDPIAATEQFGLVEYTDQLSADLPYGAQKILNLAMVSLSRPTVLLLDEPFAGVHDLDIERLSQHINRLRDEGVAIGIVEHNIEALLRLADSVLALDAGRTIFRGLPAEARQDSGLREAYLGSVAGRQEVGGDL